MELTLFPLTAAVKGGHLIIGGCDTVDLAREFGTPVYLFDEFTIRHKCIEFKREFSRRYPDTFVIYAGKAFIHRYLVKLLDEEGLGLDVVSGGELAVAHAIDFPMDRVYFHGNNKSEEELKLALEWGVGRVVVDNFYELSLLQTIAKERGKIQDILLRLSPGVDPRTHRFITTGAVDSKFGFPWEQGEKAIDLALSSPNLHLLGLHFHLGSSIYEVEPYQWAISRVLDFAATMEGKSNFQLQEFNLGACRSF